MLYDDDDEFTTFLGHILETGFERFQTGFERFVIDSWIDYEPFFFVS